MLLLKGCVLCVRTENLQQNCFFPQRLDRSSNLGILIVPLEFEEKQITTFGIAGGKGFDPNQIHTVAFKDRRRVSQHTEERSRDNWSIMAVRSLPLRSAVWSAMTANRVRLYSLSSMFLASVFSP